MTAIHFMAQLKNRGLNIYQRDGLLHYSCAKGIMTPQLKAMIKERKGEILSILDELERIREGRRPHIRNIPAASGRSISSVRRQMWPRVQASRVSHEAWLLRGFLSHASLENAFADLVQRHDMLKGSSCSPAPSFTQPYITVVDLCGLSLADRSRRSAELTIQFANSSFLGSFRVVLLQLEKRRNLLLLKLKASIADHFSLNILREEWAHLYNAASKAGISALAPIAISSDDVTHWKQFNKHTHGRQLVWWQHRLAGLGVRRLGGCKHGDRTQTIFLDFAIGNVLVEEIKEIAAHENCSLFMVLLAAWKVWLYSAGAGLDVAVGTQVDHRPFSEMEGLVASFENILVMRTHLDANPSLRDILARVRSTTLDAFRNQDVPFDEVMRACDTGLDTQGLFQTRLTLLHESPSTTRPLGLEPERVSNQVGDGFGEDISLLLCGEDNGIRGHLRISPGLFSPEEAQTIPTQLLRFLQQFVVAGDTTLEELLAEKAERTATLAAGFALSALEL